MENHIKLDLVISFISSKIAETTKHIEEDKTNSSTEKLHKLLELREQIYAGNVDVIEMVYKQIQK